MRSETICREQKNNDSTQAFAAVLHLTGNVLTIKVLDTRKCILSTMNKR